MGRVTDIEERVDESVRCDNERIRVENEVPV